MLKQIQIVLIIVSFKLISMDQPVAKKLTIELAKEIVAKYVTDKEGSYIKDTAKSSNYYKLPATPGIVALPPVAVNQEMGSALVDIYEEIGYVCTDNKVFRLVYDAEKQSYRVKNYLNLTSKVEQTDVTQPAIASMKVARLQGAIGHRVLLGEIKGRLLIADIDNYLIKTFGEINGKITQIVPHPAGTHVAVKYVQAAANDSRKMVPCVGASRASLAVQSSPKENGSYLPTPNPAGNRGSWLSPGYVWSTLVTKECVKGIDGIGWENEHLLVQCSESKKWERYSVANDALVEIENTFP